MRSTNPTRSTKHVISALKASLAPHRNKNTLSERFLTHFDPLHSSLRRLVNAFLCPFGNSGRVRKEDRQVKRNMPGILQIFWLEVGNVQWITYCIHLEVFVGISLLPDKDKNYVLLRDWCITKFAYDGHLGFTTDKD